MHKVDEVIERLRDRKMIAAGGLIYSGPLMREAADLLASMKEVLGPLADSPCACGVVVGARCLPCRARNALNGEKNGHG